MSEQDVQRKLNLAAVDFDSPNITLDVISRLGEGDTQEIAIYVAWNRDWSKTEDDPANARPHWADWSWTDRVITTMSPHTMRYTANAAGSGAYGHSIIELPCPPYNFEVTDNNELSISKGGFFKSGSKAEWQGVIDSMQEQVDELPDGINLSSMPDLSVNIRATVIYETEIDVGELLEGHDLWDGELWHGSKHELESAIEEQLDWHEWDEYDLGYMSNDVDSIDSKEFVDLSSWMYDVPEAG